MIKYITKVDDTHILEANGKNVQVEANNSPRTYKFKGVTVDANYSIQAYNNPFTTIVLAVELVREVRKQEGF